MNSTNLTEFQVPLSLDAAADPFEYEGADLEAMEVAENYPKWIVEEFSPYLKGDIADVGAGCGNFSRYLLRANIDSIHAFEPSSKMHGLLERRFENEARLESVNAYVVDVADRYSERFDAVVYNNVMEHVENDTAELEAVYRMLKPGGCVLIYVPALQWLYSDFDRSLGHFRRYDKASGSELLLGTGFTVERIKYADVLGVLPWFLMMKIMGKKLTKGSVGLYDRLGVPVTRMLEKVVPMPIGKNLVLVGRKALSN
ncbi:class I SAM-dependent methyltransferase [Pelagicoccus sp. SDUM812005]|uniref:class I SAM-dependent methyltransferase n=1 Tax=Pelagicoccus sp. SDUM812005 TaxID=3041257 RepID=UPI00280D633F|nr:class I SAM-dependent methyltransferase [Pelagicoccus sp. SDUM812005]MDQ8181759.1 class I SAM-dependent methyltransferase [Pelagicoccus sp. SDUM812005]